MSTVSRRFQRWFWLGFAVLCPAIPLHAYFAGGWNSILHSYSLGMLFGIVGFVYFANTLILAARIRYFDRLFGHDRVMVFHGRQAAVASGLAVVHGLFKCIYNSELSLQIALGITGLALLILVAHVTMLFMVCPPLHRFQMLERWRRWGTRRWDYSRLKRFHNLTALGIALLTVHILMAAPTAETRLRLSIMGAWGGTALLMWLYHKVIRVLRLLHGKMKITDVRLKGNVVRISARYKDGRATQFRAGQYGYFRVLSSACSFEEHPFTLSSGPGRNTLSITAKALGDYSNRLAQVHNEDGLMFDGPYGLFTPVLNAGPYLFIAGGIGITPFLSILSAWEQQPWTEPVTLVWSVRAQADFVDEGLLERVAAKQERLTLVPVVTRETWKGARRVDRELLQIQVAALGPRRLQAYVCGPDAFRRAILKHLHGLGVPGRAVHYESFG